MDARVPPTRSRADVLRAVLLTLVLGWMVLLALPSTERLDHARLGTPTALKAVAQQWEQVRSALVLPITPVLRLTGTGQSWAMFATPDRHPRRLEVHVETDAGWQRVFRKNHPDDRFLGNTLRYRRVRALYDTTPDDGSVAYWEFTRWVGRRALLEHPDATRVRIRLLESHTPSPWEPADPEVAVHLERIHTRLALFPEDDL